LLVHASIPTEAAPVVVEAARPPPATAVIVSTTAVQVDVPSAAVVSSALPALHVVGVILVRRWFPAEPVPWRLSMTGVHVRCDAGVPEPASGLSAVIAPSSA